jgi:hypothetical protein
MVLTRLSRPRPDGNAAPAFSPGMFSKAVYAEPLGNSVTTLREIGVSALLPTSLAGSTDTAVHGDDWRLFCPPLPLRSALARSCG